MSAMSGNVLLWFSSKNERIKELTTDDTGHASQRGWSDHCASHDQCYSGLLTASSGNKRDFISIDPYWWPNPETADGLPYIWRDGEVNLDKSTVRPFDYIARRIYILTLSSFYLENTAYSEYAARQSAFWTDPYQSPALLAAYALQVFMVLSAIAERFWDDRYWGIDPERGVCILKSIVDYIYPSVVDPTSFPYQELYSDQVKDMMAQLLRRTEVHFLGKGYAKKAEVWLKNTMFWRLEPLR